MQRLAMVLFVALLVALGAPGAAPAAELPAPSYVTGVAVEGGRACVVDHQPQPGYLRVLDLSDPARPTPLAAAALTNCGGGANPQVGGGVAFVVCDRTGYSVDARNLSAPLRTHEFASPSYPEGVDLATGRLYVTTTYGVAGEPRLLIYDLADPTSPNSASVLWLAAEHSDGNQVAGIATHVFVALRRYTQTPRLMAVDATEPASPRVLATVDLSGAATPRAIATDGTRAYVAVGEQIDVVDVSDPARPSPLGAVPTPGLVAMRLRLAPGRLYAAGEGGLRIIDLEDPTAPVLRGAYGAPGLRVVDLAVGPRHAYLALRTAGLHVIDVADPDRPTLVGTVGTQRTHLPIVPRAAGA
jgi:hypothetical protein